MRSTRVITGVAVAALVLVVSSAAGAWPAPTATATGGGCRGGTRSAIVWTAHNLETEFPRSPAHLEDVTVTPAFPTDSFAPASLPNDGTATAMARTDVPDGFAGKVTLSFRMVWDGPDGEDSRDGGLTVVVVACPPRPSTTVTVSQQQATTTTTTVPSTTTSTTSTTVAVKAEVVEPAAPAPAPEPVRVQPQFTG